MKNEAEISFISERNFCTKRYFGMSLMKRSKVYSLKFGQYEREEVVELIRLFLVTHEEKKK